MADDLRREAVSRIIWESGRRHSARLLRLSPTSLCLPVSAVKRGYRRCLSKLLVGWHLHAVTAVGKFEIVLGALLQAPVGEIAARRYRVPRSR